MPVLVAEWALQTQVLMQVHKDLPNALHGVFTRDYRYNEMTCQVLITVPACLEILLLSPMPEHKSWVQRVKYVIFDEVRACL